jgi:hypothetical protein
MNNIVADNGYVVGTLEHLSLLHCLAQQKDIHYRADDYKWKIGVKILSEISSKDIWFRVSSDTKPQLFGIDVEIDYVNPENVQLWKNVTNDL